MPNTSGLAVRVGIFVVVGLMLLIGFSLRVTNGFGGSNTYSVRGYFDSAVGLEPNAKVSLAGLAIGEVKEIGFDAERRKVRVTIALSKEHPLPADSLARIERATLLGNSSIVVRYGEQPSMLADGAEIATEEVPGLSEMMAQVSEMSAEAKGLIENFNSNQEEILSGLKGVIEDNREDIRSATKSLAEAGPKLETLADNLNAMTEDMRGGKGTMGRLLNDEQLYDDIQAFSTEMRKITADLRDGKGTLSKLLYDDALATKAEEALDKVGAAGEQLDSLLKGKEDELQSLIDSLAKVGPQIEKAAADISEMSGKMKESEGTLGLLINDPTLYKDAQRAVNQVNESFESSEEQGVIRSFVGVLFGALI